MTEVYMSAAPCPLFDNPWRKVNWGGKQEQLSVVKGYKPSTDEVNHVRILLYGPIGAKKSSYVNSVSTIILGRSAIPAGVNSNIDDVKCFTVESKTHKIKKGASGEYYPFVFNDVMGLESGEDVGVRTEDIKLAIMGHVQDKYMFNPVSSLLVNNSQYFNPCLSAGDKVHLLVCVLSANSPEVKPSVMQKMKEVKEAARDLGIPQVAIATHIDQICNEIEKDVKNVFRSKYLKEKMSELSSTVGIPKNSTFPLKNYCTELDNEDDMDTLLLTALKHMLNYANDFLDTL